MSIALLITDRDLTRLEQGIKQTLPEVKVQAWPNITEPEHVEFAIAWRQPANIWQQFPALKAVSSFGAGCDGILSDLSLPEHIQVTRIVDPELAQQMAEYVLMAVLMLSRNMPRYVAQQRQSIWQPAKRGRGKNVTLLGVGAIGDVVAQRLLSNGYRVSGWARSKKNTRDYPVYAGRQQLANALQQADFVVNLLPHTAATEQLINQDVLALMPTSCYLINVGRGATLDEQALQQALQQNLLAGAMLDVFATEPLAAAHPFWQNDKILITPHVSAITSQQCVIEQLCANYQRLILNEPLLNLVDKQLGY
jgi:glyoxylate/hydroxypyruvate reductase